MRNQVTISLPEQDIIQIIDALRARQEAYQDNHGIRLGSQVTDSEAEMLSMYYLGVIKKIEDQLHKPSPKKKQTKPKTDADPQNKEAEQPDKQEGRRKVWVTYKDQYKPGEVIRQVTKGKNAGKFEVSISGGRGTMKKILVEESKLTDRNMK